MTMNTRKIPLASIAVYAAIISISWRYHLFFIAHPFLLYLVWCPVGCTVPAFCAAMIDLKRARYKPRRIFHLKLESEKMYMVPRCFCCGRRAAIFDQQLREWVCEGNEDCNMSRKQFKPVNHPKDGGTSED